MSTNKFKIIAKKELCLVDPEWVTLLKEARKIGITTKEVRHFLKTHDRQFKEIGDVSK